MSEYLAYLAGIIDGEGSITENKINGKIYPHVYIANTEIELLVLFQEKYGQSITLRKARKDGYKDQYLWQCIGKIAKKVIRDVYPYLQSPHKKQIAKRFI